MSTKNEFIDILEKSILKVFDENGEEIKYDSLELKNYKSKYSSSGKPSLTLFLDGIPYSSHRKYKVQYKCSCGNILTILLKKFVLKERMCCPKCVEKLPDKIAWHKEYYAKKRNGETRGNKPKRPNKTYDFENESAEFKKKYFEHNLTPEEFSKIKENIYSISGIIVDGSEIEFLPYEPCHNSKKYRNMVLINGEKHNLKEIVLKCSTCGSLFEISRPLKERVIEDNFKCRYCYLVNNNFMIHKYEPGLTYQSGEELNFIENCKRNGIKIKDGPKIKYDFNGAKHTYYVDFYLPDLRYNVEIKDNHIWHIKQVESGRWDAKVDAAETYSKEKNLKYIVLFPKDINEFFEHLKR